MEPWTLDESVTHLNHGSFGACPRPVLEVQDRWRIEMEANPVLFFTKTLQPALDETRTVLPISLAPTQMIWSLYPTPQPGSIQSSAP